MGNHKHHHHHHNKSVVGEQHKEDLINASVHAYVREPFIALNIGRCFALHITGFSITHTTIGIIITIRLESNFYRIFYTFIY